MSAIPYPLLVALIMLAVAAGLWVGGRAHRELDSGEGEGRKSLGQRARSAATRGMISLWKWNRGRTKKAKPSSESEPS